MKHLLRYVLSVGLPLATFILAFVTSVRLVCAQNPELQQKVEQIKQAAAMNKQMLAQYTWVEQVTIRIKGEEKKQERFQVQLGPGGKPQKTSLGQPESQGNSRREGRLKKHVIEKKTEEYKDYADQIKELIGEYVPPDRDKLQQAFQLGNIMMGSRPGNPGTYGLMISNYLKQGDNMTIIFDPGQKRLVSLTIATYLSDPSDRVNVNAQFSRLPGGPNHVDAETIDGVSKQLTISVQNSNYQKM